MQIDIADITLSTLEGGEVRVNIGDNIDGKGYGAALPYWQTDGFRSRPNVATSTGAAQCLYLTQGNSRRVIASRDNRFLGPFGDLALGDRAIVSDCDAGLLLDQSANSIRLSSTGVTVTVDGTAGTVTLTRGGVKVELTAATLTLSWAPSDVAPVVSSITLSTGGVAIVGTVVTVNGVPIP